MQFMLQVENRALKLSKIIQQESSLYEAYKHCKAVAATGAGLGLLQKAGVSDILPSESKVKDVGVIGAEAAAARVATEFIAAIAKHRNWDRERWLQPER